MGSKKKNRNKNRNNTNTKKSGTQTNSQKKDLQASKEKTPLQAERDKLAEATKPDFEEKDADYTEQWVQEASYPADPYVPDTAGTSKDAAGDNKQEEKEADDNKAQAVKAPVTDIVRKKNAGVKMPEDIKAMMVKAAKIVLPVAACVIIIAVIISYTQSGKTQAVENTLQGAEANEGSEWLDNNPLEENAHSEINELMNTFYKALADGDMDTVKSLKVFNSDKEIITYGKKSEFIESYNDINCYTKSGIDENTYFVYVTYAMKAPGIETTAPGLEAWYVYKAEDGGYKIVGRDDMEESILAACMLVTNQDDVVDLYRKIDVSYDEALASDENLEVFMNELRGRINTSVGEALAQLETQGETDGDIPQTEEQTSDGEQTPPSETETATAGGDEEMPQNQVVNQIVKATDTVNVRSSDSEEADKIGKAQAGTELTRIEERVNGWSKVIFDGREAYIKSDYLEVVSSAETVDTTAEPVGKITALTNVNVRSEASQESTKLGTAQAGNSYDMLEDLGEWFKINYNGTIGFVKAEFFQR